MGEGYSLDVVSIRLVKDAPIMSDYRLAGAEIGRASCRERVSCDV